MTTVLITLGFWRDLLRARRVDFWDDARTDWEWSEL